MGNTSIEWTDRTWNPTRGCSRVSEGCRNCYAERQASRFSGGNPTAGHSPFYGFVKGGKWTGRVELVPDKLEEPLGWRKPARVFVNSMSDLFHEALGDEAVDEVFAIMDVATRHTFQVLTKRPGRMLRYLTKEPNGGRDDVLPNVWLGVSVEDQETADERIPLLLQTPASRRFVSYEPALERVSFRDFLPDALLRSRTTSDWKQGAALDWVIVGGESGPGARRFDLDWARSVVDECRDQVPVFVKQIGARPTDCGYHYYLYRDGAQVRLDPKGGDMSQWPWELRVREFPR